MQNALRCGLLRLFIAILIVEIVGFAPGVALAADPVVSNVSFSVRGNEHITLVDVTFTLTDADGDACWLHLWGHDAAINTAESAEATGRMYYPMSTFLREAVFIENEQFAPGTHTLTWVASVDCEETAPIAASQFQVFARASDRGRIAPGRFCVIDVSSGPSSTSYHVQYFPYVDVFQDVYKTDKIVLRELPNGSWMGIYEVTQRQYQRVTGLTPSSAADKPTRPVEMVTWNEITGSGGYGTGFIASLRSKTGLSLLNLPDETLWEFACRAGTTSYYADYVEGATLGASTDSSLGKMGWYSANSSGRTHTVGMKRPNPWGLFDMHGNAWEWTATHNQYNAKRIGGSWYNSENQCYSGYREWNSKYETSSNRGFRLALPSGSSSALAGILGTASGFDRFSARAIPGVLKDFNGNGLPDAFEDFDGNGSFNAFEDLNSNGLPDAFEDFNGNGLPDTFEDPDGNLVPDFFQALHPIRSSSHPTFLYCYFNAPATARFDWPNYRPSAANGFLYVLNKIPRTQVTLANGEYTTSRSLMRAGLGHGNWYFHLVALDASNQIIPESLERFGVRISTADPGVWSLSHPQSQTPTLLRDFEAVIFLPANADADSVVRYYYSVSQSPTTPVTKTDTSTDVPHVVVPNNAVGLNWFHIAAEDRLGNLSAIAHYGFIVAEAPPPRIWSPSHPDPAKEYGLREPTLAWAPPEGFPAGNVRRYYYTLDSEPLTIPTQQSDATTETLRAFSAQQPGSSYFHLCYEDQYGHLSPAAHFRFNIRDKHLSPVITSSTHPNPGAAYPQRQATFAWTDPENLSTQYRYILDKNPLTDPPTGADSTTNRQTTVSGLSVGTNWLHLQSLNRYGVWSDTSHSQVNIRATRPPVVTSSTHPDPNQAYGRNPAFEWTDPDGMAVHYFYVFDTSPQTEPDRSSPSTTDRFRNYVGLSDGVFYFHVRAEDVYGDLTETTHFRVVVVCCVPTLTPTPTPTLSPTPTITPTPSPSPTPHPQALLIEILLGKSPSGPGDDLNGDGVFDAADLLWALSQ